MKHACCDVLWVLLDRRGLLVIRRERFSSIFPFLEAIRRRYRLKPLLFAAFPQYSASFSDLAYFWRRIRIRYPRLKQMYPAES
jgi:hypothetical protein